MASEQTAPFPLVQWIDRRSRRQRTLALTILGLYLGWRLVGWLASVQLDQWWYGELTTAPVWRRRFFAQALLAGVSGVVSLVVLTLSSRQALRVRPVEGQTTFRPIAFFAGRLGPAVRWIAYGLPVYFSIHIAVASTDRWQQWLLFRSSRSLETPTPAVGFDLSYHLFKLPLLSSTTNWLLSLIGAALLMSVVIFVLTGSMRLPISGRRTSPRALNQLALLAGAWCSVKAFDYWFVRYPLLASGPDGRFHGAGYAQMHGPGVSLRVLALLAACTAIALWTYGFGRLRPKWPVSMGATLVVVHLACVIVLPVVLQRVVVNPAEADRELPYIAYNLAGTQAAYDLDAVTSSEIEVYDGAVAAIDADRIPIFDTSQLAAPMQVLQGTSATTIQNVDLDRYEVDGELRPVYITARNASADELPETGWVQQHLVYTHGDGIVGALADTTSAAGVLGFDDLDEVLALEHDEIYFGEGLANWFAVTGTKRLEANGDGFLADTGVNVDSFWRRSIAAVAIGDFNLVASSEFTSDSQLLFRRSLTERIGALAPFLSLDGDPYPVVADGQLLWVVDAYTTASTYPYSQFAQRSGLPKSTGIPTGVNYVHRAAVVTVDAYDGSTTIYRTDGGGGATTDPILDLWDEIFPGLMEQNGQLPPSIATHLRYGTDLFTVQSNMLGRYHVSDAETLFNGTDAWLIAPTAGTRAEDQETGPSSAVWKFESSDPDASWETTREFSPGAVDNPSSGRDELAALAIGDQSTGQLQIVRLRSADNRQITSPRVAQSLIAADPDISQLFTLLNANGSKVIFGPMTPIISNSSIVWIRSVIVTSSAASSTPRLHSILAVSNGGVGVGDTPAAAIADAGIG